MVNWQIVPQQQQQQSHENYSVTSIESSTIENPGRKLIRGSLPQHGLSRKSWNESATDVNTTYRENTDRVNGQLINVGIAHDCGFCSNPNIVSAQSFCSDTGRLGMRKKSVERDRSNSLGKNEGQGGGGKQKIRTIAADEILQPGRENWILLQTDEQQNMKNKDTGIEQGEVQEADEQSLFFPSFAATEGSRKARGGAVGGVLLPLSMGGRALAGS